MGQIGVMRERGRVVSSAVRLSHPQLHAVHAPTRLGACIFSVRDAPARGHEVQLSGPNQLLVPQAVGVQDLSTQEPGHRVQADVRMRTDDHGLLGRDLDRSEAVQEAPCADHAPSPSGEGPVNVESSHVCEVALGDGEICSGHRVQTLISLRWPVASGEPSAPFGRAFLPDLLRFPGQAMVVLLGGKCRFTQELPIAVESIRRELTSCDGRQHRASRLAPVRAVVEAAVLLEIGDVGERSLNALIVHPHAQFSEPGGVDQRAASRHHEELSPACRVAPFAVRLADLSRLHDVSAHEGIDQRRLPRPRRAEERHRAAGRQVQCAPRPYLPRSRPRQ